MMSNATINDDVRQNGNVATTSRQSASTPSARHQRREHDLQTVEAGYVLSEPEIQGVKRLQVSHRRRIL